MVQWQNNPQYKLFYGPFEKGGDISKKYFAILNMVFYVL